MAAEKIIQKVEEYKNKTIKAAYEKALEQYNEASDFYRDTGYDRYYNKMQRLESEMSKLDAYIHADVPETLQSSDIREFYKMQKDLKSLKNKVFYLEKDLNLPYCNELETIKDILRDY